MSCFSCSRAQQESEPLYIVLHDFGRLSIQYRISSSEKCSPLIVSGPSSRNVSVGGTGMFTCKASDVNSILWFVNDHSIDSITNLDDDQIIHNNGSVFTSTMAFEIHESLDINPLNSSKITCLGYCFITKAKFVWTDQSAPAVLLIQG